MRADGLTPLGCWEQYAKMAIPEGAPKAQHDAMQQAFYSGLQTVLSIELETRADPLPHVRKLFDRWREEVAASMQAKLAEELKH